MTHQNPVIGNLPLRIINPMRLCIQSFRNIFYLGGAVAQPSLFLPQFLRHSVHRIPFRPRNRGNNPFCPIYGTVVTHHTLSSARHGFHSFCGHAQTYLSFRFQLSLHPQPYFAVSVLFRIIKPGMSGLAAVRSFLFTAQFRFPVRDTGQFFQPVRTKPV